MRKNILLLILLLCANLVSVAQTLEINKVYKESDKVEKVLVDNNDEICAVLKVYVNSLPGLVFSQQDIVEQVPLSDTKGYYAVYLAPNTKTVTLRHPDYRECVLTFKNYNLRIESGKTYRVELNAISGKTTQTVAFRVTPDVARLTIDGTPYNVSEGMLQVELNKGNHEYVVEAQYCTAKKGTFTVTDYSETKFLDVEAEPLMSELTVNANVANANVYIDGRKMDGLKKYSVPQGQHRIRVSATNCVDFFEDVLVTAKPKTINAKLKVRDRIPVIISFPDGQLYVDNKEVPGASASKPVYLKKGNHLLSIYANGSKILENEVKVEPTTTHINMSKDNGRTYYAHISYPEECILYIDRQKQADGKQYVNAGQHTFTLYLYGEEVLTKEVMVNQYSSIELNPDNYFHVPVSYADGYKLRIKRYDLGQKVDRVLVKEGMYFFAVYNDSKWLFADMMRVNKNTKLLDLRNLRTFMVTCKKGSTLYVDGKPELVAESDTAHITVKHGKHTISSYINAKKIDEKEIEVNENTYGWISLKGAVDLKVAYPKGGVLYVDGKRITGNNVKVPPGRYLFTVKRNGKTIIKRYVEVRENSTSVNLMK